MTNFSSITSEWAARFSSLIGDKPSDKAVALAESVELLTPIEMAEADRQTIAAGTPGIALMEKAGIAVADAVRRIVPAGSQVVVLAGPGNNGGDGIVAAQNLADSGYLVTVGLLGNRHALRGDAARAAEGWMGPLDSLTPAILEGADVIVDALFGAGLSHPVEGVAAETIMAANESGVPIVAVDLPSGVDGGTGEVLGTAVKARETVTFFRRKPGHLLQPGRCHAGRVTVVDIGIDASTLEAIAPRTFYNIPDLWLGSFPRLDVNAHKYKRGHTVVVSGPMTRTGAARLAARGALRIGSGVVTVASPRDALLVHASHLTAIMLLPMDGSVDLVDILADDRRNAVVLGPALGVGEMSAALVEAALGMMPAVVLDADALTSFSENPDRLFEAIRGREAPTVITPHEGEFARVFPDLAEVTSKLARARAAAERSGAIVVLKGPDTVVADPEGRASVTDVAPPFLATAGSGDVLAGFIGGLLAQHMAPFEAASAAVWLHGAAAAAGGPGLISEDLPELLPAVMADYIQLEAAPERDTK